MATPLKPLKPGGVIDLEEDEDDDLWNFNSPCSSQAPQEPAATVLSSGSDDDDDLKALPAHKRRRLQRLGRLRSPAKGRGSGGEGSGGSSDVEVVAVSSAPAAKPKQPDEFDLLLQPSKARPVQRQRSAAAAAAAAALLRNQQALADLRAQLAAPVPELPEPAEEEEPEPVQPPEASASEPEEEQEEAGGERIVVKLRTQQQAEPVKLRIGAAAPFERMFDTFRRHAQGKGWVQPDTQLRFLFDGDQLSPTDTAASADVEDDCVIEVHW